ncbi:TlpA disulfide reductase family protein [Phenylobacterium sp.]|uniref:TlpA family protein disulfide reductase n=1 Tax=Phenylobacterium sp. TaxID=1871053 RepID=UPI002F40269F
MKWSLWGVGLAGVAAVVYIMAQASIHPAGGLKPLAKGEMAKLDFGSEAAAPPANTFYDARGAPRRISDFKGKVVVLNLWATWCAPCVIEMPTLARLAQAYAGKPVVVLAVSIDKGDDAVGKARAFIATHKPLDFYSDPNGKLPFALKPMAAGAPTTVIYGRDGTERGRVSGGTDWSGPDARAVIDRLAGES